MSNVLELDGVEVVGRVLKAREEGREALEIRLRNPGDAEAVRRQLAQIGYMPKTTGGSEMSSLAEMSKSAVRELLAKSDSAESDTILRSVSGEGSPAPVKHPKTGRFLSSSDPAVVEAVKAAEKVLRNPSATAHERNIAAHVLKGQVQDELDGSATPKVTGGVSDASLAEGVGGEIDPRYLAKMRRALASGAGTPRQREIVGERLTRHLLGGVIKARADAELAASNRATRAAMAAVQDHETPLSGLKGGTLTLGAPQPLGNRGYPAGYQGRGPEPASVEQQLVDELAKSRDPVRRAALAEDLTRARLALLHSGRVAA